MGVGVVWWTPWAGRGQFAVSIKVFLGVSFLSSIGMLQSILTTGRLKR